MIRKLPTRALLCLRAALDRATYYAFFCWTRGSRRIDAIDAELERRDREELHAAARDVGAVLGPWGEA